VHFASRSAWTSRSRRAARRPTRRYGLIGDPRPVRPRPGSLAARQDGRAVRAQPAHRHRRVQGAAPQPAARRPRHPPRGPDRRACPRPGVRQPRAPPRRGAETLAATAGVGPVIAASVAEFFDNPANAAVLERLAVSASRSSSPACRPRGSPPRPRGRRPLAAGRWWSRAPWRATAARRPSGHRGRAARPRARSRSGRTRSSSATPGAAKVTKAEKLGVPMLSPRTSSPARNRRARRGHRTRSPG